MGNDDTIEIDLKNAKPTRRDSTKISMQLSFPIGKGELQPDVTDTKVKPPENNVDPTSKFVGVGFGFGLGSRFIKKEREKVNMVRIACAFFTH